MRHVVVASLVVVAGLVASACGESGARRDARRALVDQLMDGGLSEDVADCVVAGFFDARNDDELQEFFAREQLLDNERAEFARLGETCLPD